MKTGGVFDQLHGARPGPDLVAVLAGLGPLRPRTVDAAGVREALPDASEQVLVARAWQRVGAWVDARLNAAVLAISGTWSGLGEDDWGREEVAAGLSWSNQAAADRLEVARALAGRCVLTGAALAAGELTYRHAAEMVHALEPLDDDTAAEVEADLMAGAGRLTPAQLARKARKAVAKADPAGADARHRRARSKRRVDFTPLPDAMAELRAILPADAAARMRAALDEFAGRSRGAGDARTLDQRRADALVALAEVGAFTASGVLTPSRCCGHATAAPRGTTEPAAARRGAARPDADDHGAGGRGGGGRGGGGHGAAGGGAGGRGAGGHGVGGRGADDHGVGGRGAGGHGVGGRGAGGHGAAGGGVGGVGAVAYGAGGLGARDRSADGGGTGGCNASGQGASGQEGNDCCGGAAAAKTRAVLETLRAGRRAVPPRIALTAPLSTVLGASDQPGELTGYGPVPATVVRELAADGRWEKWITGLGGVVTDLGRETYRPPARLAALVRATYPRCVFPGCSQPSYRCDLDHNVRRIDGGPTSAANLVPLCLRHHRAKDEAGWELTHHPDTGVCTWTSPAGHVYTVAPPDQSDNPGERPSAPDVSAGHVLADHVPATDVAGTAVCAGAAVSAGCASAGCASAGCASAGCASAGCASAGSAPAGSASAWAEYAPADWSRPLVPEPARVGASVTDGADDPPPF